MKVLTNIDLMKNQISNAAIESLASAPANPVAGQVYFDTTKKVLMTYDGTEWKGEVARDSHYELVPAENASNADTLATIPTPAQGDIAVIKRTIGTDKYSYTSYVYDGSAWGAMDGNYDAENVYFDKDLTITAAVGVQTIPSSGSKTLNTTGKNVKQVLDMLFAEEKNPTKTNPSVSSVSYNGTAAGSYEAGTTINPQYTVNFSAGSYTYGPATGITATGYIVSDTKGGSASTQTGSFTSFKIAAGETYKIFAIADYGQGAMPVTNLGNEYPSARIAAGTTASKAGGEIKGYQQGYYFGTLTSKVAGSDLTSAQIRGLASKPNANYSAGNKTMTVPVGTATIVLACPADKTGVTKVLNTTVNADMTTSFVKSTVKVAGADGDTTSDYAKNYNVWVYSPAEAYGSAANLTITLG